jgi:hypothetical protein
MLDLQKENPQMDEKMLIYRADKGYDPRRDNAPTALAEIAGILPGDGTETSGRQDIQVYSKRGGVRRISQFNGAYDPLHYVLMYPYGDMGYHFNIPHYNLNEKDIVENTSMSMKDFYAYKLMCRDDSGRWLHSYGRLFQQYIVDTYAKIENERLLFIRNNQGTLRADCYNSLQDAYTHGEAADQIGQKFILPATFIGSQRHMNNLYQDAMAIVSQTGKPDYFLTFTCNPHWKEIQDELLPGQTAIDRPDLCSRIFNLKLAELIKDLRCDKVLGSILAMIYTIEFQKRGLPHAHFLITVDNENKPRSSDDFDQRVCAEIPDPIEDPQLYETVTKCMLHGPCHVLQENSPCWDKENRCCTKKFPRTFADVTISNDDGYPVYRRRNDGRKFDVKGVELDNRSVVSYNPDLCRKYNAHINLEICNSVKAVKYIYKYVYKGHDRATIEIANNNDEISIFLTGRYISASESMHRVLGYKLHGEYPSVMALEIHLPDQQFKVYDSSTNIETLLEKNFKTTLTTWLDFNNTCAPDELSLRLLYREMPRHYTYSAQKKWKLRMRDHVNMIGRIHYVCPKAGEKYFLRLLLNHVVGPKSFKDIRTYNDVVYETFKEAALARGLLEDDNEWMLCLEEASAMASGMQLRELFAVILSHCSPTSPLQLWNRFKQSLSEDYLHKELEKNGDSIARAENLALCDIDDILNRQQISIKDFWSFPLPNRDQRQRVPLLIRQELANDIPQLLEHVDISVPKLNVEQRNAYDKIISSVTATHTRAKCFFLMGAGGSGKTFVENLLLAKVRSMGDVALGVASSGIAALLLANGTTAHSRFKIPLVLDETSTCAIKKGSDTARLVQMAKLIVWDEAPMSHKYAFEALDRTLRDLMENDVSFGGKVVVVVGDFKQVPPVVQHGSRNQIIQASLKKSYLWKYMRVLKLKLNMRVLMSTGDEANEQAEFANFLHLIGTGQYATDDLGNIDLPSDLIQNSDNLPKFIDSVYENLQENAFNADYMKNRAILAAKNDEVDRINNIVLDNFPGDKYQYFSADSIVETEQNNNFFTTEYLNSISVSGVPPHKLVLKIGCPIMLLRNTNPAMKLCNGTRLIIKKLQPHVIEAEVFGSSRRVFIPKMSISPSDVGLPFKFQRRQFPIRPAFSMTINKSQGQTMKSIGLYIPLPVFTHGQLYVALSRVGSRKGIKIFIDKNVTTTRNIVYPELLLGE